MTKRLHRRAAEQQRQRNDILDVAIDAFAARGYEGASMNEIAEASGYSVGHIYNVIGNKETLFETVMMRESSELATLVAAVMADNETSTAERIDRLVDTVLGFFDSHRAFFEIYLNVAGGMRANIERRFPQPLLQLKKQTDTRVRKLFASAAAEGLTGNINPGDMAIAFSELINGFIAAWGAAGYPGHITRKAKIIKQLLWGGIRG